MSGLIVGLVLLILVVILVVFVVIDFTVPSMHYLHKEMFQYTTGPTYNLGNKLSGFFFQEMIAARRKLNAGKHAAKPDSLYAKLVATYNPTKKGVSYKVNSWDAFRAGGFWQTNHKAWASVQPFLSERLWALCEPDNDEGPDLTVHIRCDDTPFSKIKGYNLLTSKVVRTVVDSLDVPIKSMLIVTGMRPNSANGRAEKCLDFVAAFERGVHKSHPHIQISTKSESADKDFFTLMRAKRLIVSHSSFAFFAGLACKGEVYAVAHGFRETHCNLHDRWRWLNGSDFVVHHETVKDYILNSQTACDLIEA